MDFDDSFFEGDSNSKKGRVEGLCEGYNPKVCEPEVSIFEP